MTVGTSQRLAPFTACRLGHSNVPGTSVGSTVQAKCRLCNAGRYRYDVSITYGSEETLCKISFETGALRMALRGGALCSLWRGTSFQLYFASNSL
jgi:hypothetical protein